MGHLQLFVPEWHGYSVDDSPQTGAEALRQMVFGESDFTEIPIDLPPDDSKSQGIHCFSNVLRNTKRIRKEIELADPDSIFTLGGTCGIELGPVTWLNQKYDGDLAVVWLDAHADLNTPESSPSGHFHGMPVRAIVGEGDAEICSEAFSALSPLQIFQVGVRDLDPPEAQFISANSVSCFPADVLAGDLVDAIRSGGFKNVYIHFDLDVLDPKEFQNMIFHVEKGMTLQNALATVDKLSNEFRMVGSSLLEYVENAPIESAFLKQLARLLTNHS